MVGRTERASGDQGAVLFGDVWFKDSVQAWYALYAALLLGGTTVVSNAQQSQFCHTGQQAEVCFDLAVARQQPGVFKKLSNWLSRGS